MKTIEVWADASVDPVVAYEYLLDFTNYAEYCRYVNGVDVDSDGSSAEAAPPTGAGTTYTIRLGWWRISVDLRAEVSQVEHPRTIQWRVLSDVDAHGRWEVHPPDSADGPVGLRFVASYDSAALERTNLDLPRFVPMARVIDKLMPLMMETGCDVLEQIVWDLEATRRSVNVRVRTSEGSHFRRSG